MTPLHLEYTITPQDLSEATRRWTIHPGLMALTCAALACLLLVPQAIHPEIPLINPQPIKGPTPWFEILMPLVEWGLVLVVIWVTVFRVLRRISAQPWEIRRQRTAAPSPSAFWACIAIAAVVIIGAIAWTISAKRRAAAALGPAVDPDYSPAFETIFSMFPFLLLSLALPLFLRRTSSAKRAWARAYQFHRPFAADIDETSIRISESFATLNYKWPYFRGYTESPNLFLLYPSAVIVIPIPKAAFPTPEARQQFADFLARTIVPPTTGFPVLPALPLPALPAGPPPPSPTARTEAPVVHD